MPIKDILVQMDAGRANASRLDVAIDLARRHQAQVIGLCVFDLRSVPGAGIGRLNPEDALALMEWQERLRNEGLAQAANVQETFNETLRREAIDGEWRLLEGQASQVFAQHARYADLTILSQEDPEEGRISGWTGVLEGALFGAGGPLLLLPYAGHFDRIGRRVLIGWNGGREAARAVHDALPLIAQAEAVTVLAIDPDHGNLAIDHQPGADIARHLARHGLPVTTRQTTANGLSAADILLNDAADLGSDLIVVGGYGHSRLREIVLGGVTRSLLRHATVPVLMSH